MNINVPNSNWFEIVGQFWVSTLYKHVFSRLECIGSKPKYAKKYSQITPKQQESLCFVPVLLYGLEIS